MFAFKLIFTWNIENFLYIADIASDKIYVVNSSIHRQQFGCCVKRRIRITVCLSLILLSKHCLLFFRPNSNKEEMKYKSFSGYTFAPLLFECDNLIFLLYNLYTYGILFVLFCILQILFSCKCWKAKICSVSLWAMYPYSLRLCNKILLHNRDWIFRRLTETETHKVGQTKQPEGCFSPI